MPHGLEGTIMRFQDALCGMSVQIGCPDSRVGRLLSDASQAQVVGHVSGTRERGSRVDAIIDTPGQTVDEKLDKVKRIFESLTHTFPH